MDAALALAFAEAALARGDNNQSLAKLEELAKKYPINSQEGTKIRMLMITAWMGKGEDKKAISICRQLTRSKDNEIHQTSKQLLSVLESPSLERPANWSIQIPNLDTALEAENNFHKTEKKQLKTKTPSLPPTGPTRGLDLIFSTLVLIILAGLTIILSGCVKITTEMNVPGPDKIKLGWHIESTNKKLLPWQIEFENSLKYLVPKSKIFSTSEGEIKVETPVLRAQEASLMMKHTFSTAAQSAGFEISPPILSLKEKNWIIGVQQNLKLIVNLEALPEIPGLKLRLLVHHANGTETKGTPFHPTMNGDHLNWEMKQGEVNTLELYQWRWNELGVGTLLIIMLLGLNLLLQRIRLKMGFGFPELPP